MSVCIIRPLKTINEQVLLYGTTKRASVRPPYSADRLKLGLPMGLGGGVDLGYWSNSKEWTEDNRNTTKRL